MLISLLLLACSNPEPAALAACQAVPGLSSDAAGLALLEPLLTTEELVLLREAAPTRGQEVVGSTGLATIRDQTACEVVLTHSAGSGRWAVTLKRTLPTVGPDGTLGSPEEQELEWQVINADGVRVETGLGIATSMRRSIGDAIEKQDYARATSSWKAIQRSYHDPLLSVDIAEAEAFEEAWRYRSKLDGWVEKTSDTEVVIAVENKGDRAVVDAELTITFTVGEGTLLVTAALGPVAAGEIGRVNIAIPEGAAGRVTVKTAGVTL